MTPKTDAELGLLYSALDELMVCKSQPAMSIANKDIWLKRLVRHRTDAILWAIESVIERTGRWPELAEVLNACADWRRAHSASLQDEREAAFARALLQQKPQPETESENQKQGEGGTP